MQLLRWPFLFLVLTSRTLPVPNNHFPTFRSRVSKPSPAVPSRPLGYSLFFVRRYYVTKKRHTPMPADLGVAHARPPVKFKHAQCNGPGIGLRTMFPKILATVIRRILENGRRGQTYTKLLRTRYLYEDFQLVRFEY